MMSPHPHRVFISGVGAAHELMNALVESFHIPMMYWYVGEYIQDACISYKLWIGSTATEQVCNINIAT